MPAENVSDILFDFGVVPNFRHVRHYSERVCFVLSILTNTTILAILLREKNRVMKPYSRVLVLNCIFDYCYTLTCAIIEVVSFMRTLESARRDALGSSNK